MSNMSSMDSGGIVHNPLLYLTPNANSSEIFKYIQPLSNDNISNMGARELRKMLTLLDKYRLEYRKILGVDSGVLFKASTTVHPKGKKGLDHLKNVVNDNDLGFSVDDLTYLLLNVTSQTLTDSEEAWSKLKNVSDSLKKVSMVNSGCTGSVLVHSSIFDNDTENHLDFMRLWATYEHIIYRFLNGEYSSFREDVKYSPKPLAQYLLDITDDLYEIKNMHDLMSALYEEIDSTTLLFTIDYDDLDVSNKDKDDDEEDEYPPIEYSNNIVFNCPSATLNPIIWQNNINLIIKMMLAIKSQKIDFDVVDDRLQTNFVKNFTYTTMFSDYNEVFLQQALEFADLVFDNNFDKVYFLKQYLKSFEVCNGNGRLRKAKDFTISI